MSDGDRLTPVMPENQSASAFEERRPWERQESEPEDAWAAFKAYCDMEPPRRLNMSGYLAGVKVPTAMLSNWYRNWRWNERVEAYDVLTRRIVMDQRKAVLEQATDEITADHLAILKDLRTVLALETRKYLDAAMARDGVGLIKPADLKGLIEATVKLTRLEKGQSTEKIEQDVDLSGMSVDELLEWNERLQRGKPA